MTADDQDARVRLGELLAARRIEIDPRYSDRMLFAVERMGSRSKWRTIYDLEHARRDHFRPGTLRALERAYHLVPDSLDRFGGELEPLPAAPPAEPPRLAAVPSPVTPEARLFALERVASLIPDASEAEMGVLEKLAEVAAAGDEVLELAYRMPDPNREGRLLALEKRVALMVSWLRDIPNRALDDEGRTGTA